MRLIIPLLVLAVACRGNDAERFGRGYNELSRIRNDICQCKFKDTKCLGEHEREFAAWKREFADWKPRDADDTRLLDQYRSCVGQLKDLQATLADCAPIRICAKLSHDFHGS